MFLFKVIKMHHETIAFQYLYTDLAIKNLERDLQLIQTGPFKIKEPYIHLLEKFISQAINERRKLKKLMYQHNIRVEQTGKVYDSVIYHFYLNNRVKEVSISKYVLKKRVKEYMLKLLEPPAKS